MKGAIKPPLSQKEQDEALTMKRLNARIENERKIEEASEMQDELNQLLKAARNAHLAELEAKHAQRKLAAQEAYEKEIQRREAEKARRAAEIENRRPAHLIAKKAAEDAARIRSKGKEIAATGPITRSKGKGPTGPSAAGPIDIEADEEELTSSDEDIHFNKIDKMLHEAGVIMTPAYMKQIDRFANFSKQEQKEILNGKNFPKTPKTLERWIDSYLSTVGFDDLNEEG